VDADDQRDPDRREFAVAAPAEQGGADIGDGDLDGDTTPNAGAVSRSRAVPSAQRCHVRMAPRIARSTDPTETTVSGSSQALGGLSWAHPNQAEAKNAQTTTVAAASR
jgi:hypothetical protein